jgi:hypothetical protein
MELYRVDLWKSGFALLVGPQGSGWRAAVDALDADGTEPPITGHSLSASGPGDSPAALVRPDGFIAWRAESDDHGGGIAALRHIIHEVLR